MIPLAITLASHFLPELVNHLAGPHAASVATSIVKAASAVTGVDPSHPDAQQQMMDALQKDPSLIAQMQSKMLDERLGERQADSADLAQVNQTWRAELSSSDKYNSRWRATMGYALTFTWTIQMCVISWVIGHVLLSDPKQLAALVANLSAVLTALAALWGIPLSVLGLAVHQRSKDKQTAAGMAPASVIASIGNVISGIKGGANG